MCETHHVHDSKEEALCCLGSMVLHHVCVGHHHRLYNVFSVHPNGVSPPTSVLCAFRLPILTLPYTHKKIQKRGMCLKIVGIIKSQFMFILSLLY